MKKTDSALVVISDGEDPYLIAEQFKGAAEQQSSGPYTVNVKMKSQSSGEGAVFYNRPFAAVRSVSFDVQHDGEWHEYRIEIPAKSLTAFRLDPSRGSGRIEIESLQIRDQDQNVLYESIFK